MGDNTKLMSIVFSLEDPLITREYPSDIVLFRTFTSAQTNTALWTPASGKKCLYDGLASVRLCSRHHPTEQRKQRCVYVHHAYQHPGNLWSKLSFPCSA